MSEPRYAQEYWACDVCGHYPVVRFTKVFDTRKMPQETLICKGCGNTEVLPRREKSDGEIVGTRGTFHWEKVYEANSHGRIVE